MSGRALFVLSLVFAGCASQPPTDGPITIPTAASAAPRSSAAASAPTVHASASAPPDSGPVDPPAKPQSITVVEGTPQTLSDGTTIAAGKMIYVGSSRVDLQACKLEYSIVSPK